MYGGGEVTDLTQHRALAAAARAETSDGLEALERMPDIVEELAGLLEHADEFVFRADLSDLQPIGGDWFLRIGRCGDAWVIWWAWTGRAWTRKHGTWLDSDAVDMALLVGPAGPVSWRTDILFGLAEALEAVPRILEDLADRARKAVSGGAV
jgi:hypothetical protein